MVDSSSGVSGASSSNSSSAGSSVDTNSSNDSSIDQDDSQQSQTSTEQLANEPTTEDRLSERDLASIPAGLSGSAQGMLRSDYTTQVDNPILDRQWESTRSAWTGEGGFTDGAIDVLEGAGLTVADVSNPVPAGSRIPGGGYSAGESTTSNGDLASDAIADHYRNAGFNVETEVHYDANLNRIDSNARLAGDRFVDIAVDIPHPSDPRLNTRLEIESKACRVSAGSIDSQQLAHDARSVSANRTIRAGGAALERVGRVARPIGVAVDAIQIGSAYRADGNRYRRRVCRGYSRKQGI